MTFSVIICSADDAKFDRACRMYARHFAGVAAEIIRISDAAGLAEGYNRGLSQCKGDLVLFAHDDVQFLGDDFSARLLGHMEHCDVLGVAGTRRLCSSGWLYPGLPYACGQIAYPNAQGTGDFAIALWSVPTRRIDRIQALDGVFICARRGVAEAVRFDSQTFTRFHLYDIDFSFRAHRAGHRVAVAADLYPLHDSGGSPTPEWAHAAKQFQQKFAPDLAPTLPWNFQNAILIVPTLEDVMQAMTPPHWGD